MTSMSGTTTTECHLVTTPPPAPETTLLPAETILPLAGTMTDTMTLGIATMTRGRNTTRKGLLLQLCFRDELKISSGTATGMPPRPGHIMTDPQFQGETTKTPESMKGDAFFTFCPTRTMCLLQVRKISSASEQPLQQ